MVIDFCLKLTPTYDVISLLVALQKLSNQAKESIHLP